jgi:hypothetical protein
MLHLSSLRFQFLRFIFTAYQMCSPALIYAA